MSKKHNITKKQSDQLYKDIKLLHDILTKNKIYYWVSFGTLLGAIRHRGLIPWDDDADICILRKDVSKFKKKIIPYLEKKNFDVEEGDPEDKKQKCNPELNNCTFFVEGKTKNSLGIDVFIVEKIGPMIQYSDPYWRFTATGGGYTCYFLYNFVFPLVPVRFGNFWVFTPKNAINHLNKCYGNDWAAKSQRLYDHRKCKWVNSKKKIMSYDSYETIPAPKSTCTPLPPKVPCKKIKISGSSVSKLTNKEIKILAKLMNIKGINKKSRKNLEKIIKKI